MRLQPGCILGEIAMTGIVNSFYVPPLESRSQKTLNLNYLRHPENFKWSYFAVGGIEVKIWICTFWSKIAQKRE